MAKLNIVLADSDELFLDKLTNYFMEKTELFEVFSFTAGESLRRFIGDKSNKTDILAFTGDLADEALRAAHIPLRVLLADGPGESLPGCEALNKYQKADKFISAILMRYAEKTGRIGVVQGVSKKTKVIGVYSPVGGGGKTTAALALAACMAKAGLSVFYLNFEIINSTAGILNAGPAGSLSDVLLALKTKGANVAFRILADKHRDPGLGIYYINPSESALEINELSVTEQLRLIRELDGLGEFDAVVADFDSAFTQAKLELLEACDFILLPFTPEEVSLGKVRLLLDEFGMHRELSHLFAKLRLAVNKADGYTEALLAASGIPDSKPVEITIPLLPELTDLRKLADTAAGAHIQSLFGAFAAGLTEG